MFKSISKYSPKNLLASYLSLSLAQFFNVDPTRVETNLLQDAKVLLNDVDIKERRLGGRNGSRHLRVSGSIQQIEFSWTWDTAALIKDVRLTVRGVSIHVNLVQAEDEHDVTLSDDCGAWEEVNPEATAAEEDTTDSNTNEAPSDWKAKYMQQIIDHLTLEVTDITFSIGLSDEGSQAFLQAKGMELVTLPRESGGEDNSSALMQTISLASIEAWVEEQNDAFNKFPILEPFGYKARVTRLHGRRFLDGVLSGLFVKGDAGLGDSSCVSSAIRIHVGVKQIEGLNSLQRILLSVGYDDMSGEPDSNEKNNQGINSSNALAETKSFFHLPFKGMELILENTTNLRLVGCNVLYCTDGSKFCVECSGGIWVDNEPLSKDSMWILDLVSSELLLDSLPLKDEYDGDFYYSAHDSGGDLPKKIDCKLDQGQPFKMGLSFDMFQKMYCGIRAVMPQCTDAMESMSQYSQPSQKSSWTMRSSGPVSFRFTGKSNVWVEVLAESLKLGQTSSSTISFECKSTEISSNAGFEIQIPQISTNDDGCLFVEHRISATADSADVCKVLQTIFHDIMDVIGSESTGSSGIPVNLYGIDISLKDSQMSSVHLSRIIGSGVDYSIGKLQVHEVGNVTLDASALQITLDTDKINISVQKINRLAYNKVDYLPAPIQETTIIVENGGVLSVACKEVYIKYPDEGATNPSNSTGPGKESFLLPSLHLTVEHFQAKSNAMGSIEICGVNLWIRNDNPMEKAMVDLDLESMKARAKDICTLSCGKINSSIEIGDACGDNNELILFPGISLSSASLTVHEITHLSTVAGHLSKPLDIIEITYGAKTAMVKCDKILFCTKKDYDFGSQSGIQKNSDGICLPFDVYFEVDRIVAMQEFGPGLPGLCCDGLRLHFRPSEAMICVNATCNYIQGRDKTQADFSAKGVKLNLQKNLIESKAEFLDLKEMELTLSELSTLSIPGKFALARPIYNSTIHLKDNFMKLNCDRIHVSCVQPVKKCIDAGEEKTSEEFARMPVSFGITVNQVIIDSATSEVVCNQISTQYLNASPTVNSLQLDIKSVNGKFGTNSFKLDGIAVFTKWQVVEFHGNKTTIPYLGSLSFAQAELESCTEMTTPFFSLIEPIHRTKFLFQEGFLVLEFADIQLDLTNAATSSGGHEDHTSRKFDLEMFRVPIGFNVSNKLRLKTTTFDIHFQNFGLDFVRSSSSPQGEVFIHCDRLIESASVSAKKVDFRFHLTLNPTGTEVKDYVEKASVKVYELTSLCVEGKGCLSQPLLDSEISYQGGILSTDIQKVKFELLCFEQSQVLCLEGLNVKIQTDPFDPTIRFIAYSVGITGNGAVSFSAAGINLVTTIAPITWNENGLNSKSLEIPSLGCASLIVLDVSEIGHLSIQSMGRLTQPIKALSLRFENDSINLKCPTLFLERSMVKKHASLPKSNQSREPFDFPFKASLSIEKFRLQNRGQDKAILNETQCRSLTLTLQPQGHGTKIQVIGNDFKNIQGSTVVDVPRLSVSALVKLKDLDKLYNLVVVLEKAQLAAEFSSSSWTASNDADTATGPVICLPFASIPKFDLTLRYVGTLMNINDATIACDEFQGTGSATLSRISKHYAGIVTRRIPYLLAKADVANCNVGDSVCVAAGKVLTHTTVLGATVGVASRDIVGSALTVGKESRGASSSDKYQFGDFTRGVLSSVKSAAAAEAEMRGDDSYQVGDVTSSTVKAAGKYASENKCRLAGAGGSAIGMGVGAALLGPVGFVAGSMIGGSAAKSSVAAIAGEDPKKDYQNSSTSPRRNETKQQVPSNRQHPDLLSFENSSRGTSQQELPRQLPAQSFTAHQSHNQAYNQTNMSQVPDLLSSGNNYHAAPGAYQQQLPRPIPAQSLQQPRQSNDASRHIAHRSGHQNYTPTASTTSRQAHSANSDQQGYQFGDITRGIVSRGKKTDGRNDNSGYKFGDFTRGLFG